MTPEKPLPFVSFADSTKVRVGQWAIAIGSPFGQQNTVTTGIISALHRTREIYGASMIRRRYANLIQADAPINPGNSGGPLLNIHGEMVGVNVAIFSPNGSSSGIGYAIPANTAKWIMEQLIDKGRVFPKRAGDYSQRCSARFAASSRHGQRSLCQRRDCGFHGRKSGNPRRRCDRAL